MGAFETINLVADVLPLDYAEAPQIFSEKEIELISSFLALVDRAADATETDTWQIQYFKSSEEWVRLSEFAKEALVSFEERGHFSEDTEEDFVT